MRKRLFRPGQAFLIALVILLMRVGPVSAQDHTTIEIVPGVGHASAVNAVAFSPDGARVLSGSQDKTVKLWDRATGALIRTFEGHADSVRSVAFSPDGTRVLSGSSDKTLKLWEAESGRLIRTFTGHSGWVWSVVFSPDGARALSGSDDRTVKLWEVDGGRLIRTLQGHSNYVYSVAFSPDGARALSGSNDRTVKLWEVESGRLIRTFTGHASPVSSVAFSPDGARVLSGSYDNTMKLWEIESGLLIRTFTGHSLGVWSVAFSPDGARVLSAGGLAGGGGTLKLWETGSGRLIRTFEGHREKIHSVAFSPDGAHILSGSAIFLSGGGHLKLWEVESGRLIRTIEGQSYIVRALAVSPNGARILSGGDDFTVKLWEAESGRLIRTFTGHSGFPTSVAFSPDGARVLSGSSDGTVRLWEAESGRLIRTITEPVWLRSVAFSPDGTHVLSAGDDAKVKLWNVESGLLIRTFEGHSRWVRSVALSADGAHVLSGSDDRTVKLWEVESGRLIRTFTGHASPVSSVAFSPDGARVLSGSYDNTMKLWEIESGLLIRTFTGHSLVVWSVAFSPDGARVLSAGGLAGGGGTLKLWETGSGRLIRTFTGHSDAVSSVAFSPDGARVLSGGHDGAIRVWDPARGDLLASLHSSRAGEWLAITPKGFFAASSQVAELVSIVRGLDVTLIDQVHQSLFNPDLVREAFTGDLNGEVALAAEVINLDRVLDSGPAPMVAITSHPEGSQSSSDLVTVAVRITDRGKGIGRIEWRINGVTAAVAAIPLVGGPDYDMSEQLALNPGDNTVEVVAYNASNLLASPPVRTTVNFAGPRDAVKPTLHVLAVGINAYRSSAFSRLKFAAHDARVFGAAITKAAEGVYESVRVTPVIDEDATPGNLDRVFETLGRDVQPRDTFIFFASAHGYSRNGRFYLIPQDYPDSLDAIETHAISQGRIQNWIANRIKARKAILLLDTCESGALVAGHTKSRVNAPASEASIGRLHEATGRPVLTAAASGRAAFEGYREHGVFTWALLDALRHGDSNANGTIELSELAAHVQSLVPKIGAELNSQTRGFAVIGPGGAPQTSQSARFGSRGEDFALVRRLQ